MTPSKKPESLPEVIAELEGVGLIRLCDNCPLRTQPDAKECDCLVRVENGAKRDPN
jgi:hypothetical protein